MAGVHLNRHDGNYNIDDSLSTLFALLSNTLPGCRAGIYLERASKGGFALRSNNDQRHKFLKFVPAATADALPTTGGSKRATKTLRLRDHQAAKWMTKGGLRAGASVLAHPLHSNGRLAGLIIVELPKGLDRHKQAETILDLAAKIIQNDLILSSELESAQAENAILSDLMSHTGSIDIASTSEALVSILVREIRGILRFDRLTICIQPPEWSGSLEIKWTEGLKEDHAAGFAFSVAGVVHGKIFSSARPIIIRDMQTSKHKGRYVAGDIAKSALKSFIGVPIREAGTPAGTLSLESRQAGFYDPQDVDLLMATAQVYGTAMIWSQKYQEVHSMATIDGLTQLLNRRSFLERMSEELERASRYGETMTFLMLDLDQFKSVNDTHGHLFGDYVLFQTAQLVRSCIRKADVAGRYGGEEYTVIIINASTKTSLSTAQRIRHSIADFKFSEGNIEARITVSIGMSEYPKDGQDLRSVIQCADEAMYQVKRQGGNGVISYDLADRSAKTEGD